MWAEFSGSSVQHVMTLRFSWTLSLVCAIGVLPPIAAYGQDASADYTLGARERAAFEQLVADSGTTYPLIDSWHAGVGLQYYTFGRETLAAAALYRVRGGGDIVTSLPGTPGYTSVRLIYEVQLNRGMDAATVRSHLQVESLALAGKARIVATGRMHNLPIVPPASVLERDPAHRSLKSAWFKGQEVHYFDFGPARVEAIPQVLFVTGVDSTGQLARVPGQPSNVSFVPPDPSYRDLWDLTLATVEPGFATGTYRDFSRALTGAAHAHYTLSHPGIIVNCPVVYVNGKAAVR